MGLREQLTLMLKRLSNGKIKVISPDRLQAPCSFHGCGGASAAVFGSFQRRSREWERWGLRVSALWYCKTAVIGCQTSSQGRRELIGYHPKTVARVCFSIGDLSPLGFCDLQWLHDDVSFAVS